MTYFAITHPSATIARGLENLIILGENSKYRAITYGIRVLSRAISTIVFPIFLTLELAFKRLPKIILSLHRIQATEDDPGGLSKVVRNANKAIKFFLAILATPLSLKSPDVITEFFLKNPPHSTEVKPFGVENIFGNTVAPIQYPKSAAELKFLIGQAIRQGKQVTVIGAGMSQGIQTVPSKERHLVVDLRYLNKIKIKNDRKTVICGAGATWDHIQLELNKRGLSTIVKQASDVFSVGGSIGINCHGWAHKQGAISSTVKSVTIIDYTGQLKTLSREKDFEHFRCMFGTLGYFGIIVSAELEIVPNEHLIEKSEPIAIADFHQKYTNDIESNPDVDLFGGRLCIADNLFGHVEMNQFRKDTTIDTSGPVITPNFTLEQKRGTRYQRIALQALAHLSEWSTRKAISFFWNKEVETMHKGRKVTRNEALHPPINAFMMLHHSNLHAQWLQEYFIAPENLPDFLKFLGGTLKENNVRVVNATIRPTPPDPISILPYADKKRYAVVISFDQYKIDKNIAKTKAWIEKVNEYVVEQHDRYYQAYMPYASQEQFIACYGKEAIERLRMLKRKYDPNNIFGNAHTAKYFDEQTT